MKITHLLGLAATAVLANGCASLPREPDAATLARHQLVAGAPVSSIPYSSVSSAGFSVVDDEHVLLTTRPTVAYLLKLSGPCLAFDRGSPSLMVTSSLGRIQSRFDRIGSLREPNMTCLIQEIRPVDVKALREAEKAAPRPG